MLWVIPVYAIEIFMHLTEVHLTEVHLTEVHLTEVHLTGVHLTEVHLTEVHLKYFEGCLCIKMDNVFASLLKHNKCDRQQPVALLPYPPNIQ